MNTAFSIHKIIFSSLRDGRLTGRDFLLGFLQAHRMRYQDQPVRLPTYSANVETRGEVPAAIARPDSVASRYPSSTIEFQEPLQLGRRGPGRSVLHPPNLPSRTNGMSSSCLVTRHAKATWSSSRRINSRPNSTQRRERVVQEGDQSPRKSRPLPIPLMDDSPYLRSATSGRSPRS